MVSLADGEKKLRIRLLVLTQYTNVTDARTDRHRATAWAALMHSIARQLRPIVIIIIIIIIIITIIIISKTMFMVLSSWQSHCESSPGSLYECRTAPSGRRPKTKPDDLGYESACIGCQNLHPPSPFIIITQPESWYSFYRPTEGRRPSRPSWLVTYGDGLHGHPSWY